MKYFKISIALCFGLFVFSNLNGTNVKDFGAKGDGVHDDTKAILKAVNEADDGIIIFPKGKYRITKTIEIILSKTGRIGLRGNGGSPTILMEGSGPAIRFTGSHSKGTADPNTLDNRVWENERMPIIQDLEILGNHPEATGIELLNTFQATIKSVLIRQTKNGIHLKSRNRNVIIEGCHIYNCTNIGIFLDAVNIHQINISHSHISYNNRSGIKVQGSEIRNFQITGNDIEYNYDQSGEASADIWVDASEPGSSVREGTITGNTIQSKSSKDGCNILFVGEVKSANKIGLWSITGNHISNQSVNVHLKSVRGVSISGNSFTRGYDRHIVVENSQNIAVGTNVLDSNEDYFTDKIIANGGIKILGSKNINCSDNIIDGVDNLGAIEVNDSEEISISNCQIKNPKSRGIQLENSRIVSINGCTLTSKQCEEKSGPEIGIFINKDCSYINICNNIFDLGLKESFRDESELGRENLIHSNMNIY